MREIKKDLCKKSILYWNPGWVETPKSEWQNIIQNLTLRESWIMDGNYGGTLDIRLAIADTVIFLDLKRLLCLWRVIKRSWQYAGQTRPDMASDCPERLTWEFIKFVWTYPISRRPNILDKLGEVAPNQQVIILREPKEVREFLQTISSF